MCKSKFLWIPILILTLVFLSTSFSFACEKDLNSAVKDRQITVSQEVKDSISKWLQSVKENAKTDGWKHIDGKTYYYVDNEPLVGRQIIDGKEYYFNGGGEMSTGFSTLGARIVYYDKYTGEKLSLKEALKQIFGGKE